MNILIGYLKSISFHLKWVFLSPKERYAILWAKTLRSSGLYSLLE